MVPKNFPLGWLLDCLLYTECKLAYIEDNYNVGKDNHRLIFRDREDNKLYEWVRDKKYPHHTQSSPPHTEPITCYEVVPKQVTITVYNRKDHTDD
jgi:hypothetical protein